MKTTAFVMCVCSVMCALGAAGGLVEPDAPLRGPDVPDERTSTLVRKTMTGRLVQLEVRPEVAALQELGLDETTAERAQAVVEGRTEAVTMLLVDELDRIKAMTDRRRDGKNEEAQRLFRELWTAFEPGEPIAPLIDDLEPVLGDDEHARLVGLVDEYWEARIDWALRDNKRKDDADVRGRVAARLAYQSFQREVTQAYEGSLRRYQQAIDAIADAVRPTPEQREQIREIIIEHIKATRLKATPAERRATNLKIYRMLDDNRQERLFEYMTGIVIPDQG